jgi:hypothetical protein
VSTQTQTDIRAAIAQQMAATKTTTYALARKVADAIPQGSVYRIISDKGETTMANLGRILAALDLEIRPRGSTATREPARKTRAKSTSRRPRTAAKPKARQHRRRK